MNCLFTSPVIILDEIQKRDWYLDSAHSANVCTELALTKTVGVQWKEQWSWIKQAVQHWKWVCGAVLGLHPRGITRRITCFMTYLQAGIESSKNVHISLLLLVLNTSLFCICLRTTEHAVAAWPPEWLLIKIEPWTTLQCMCFAFCKKTKSVLNGK